MKKCTGYSHFARVEYFLKRYQHENDRKSVSVISIEFMPLTDD